MIRTIKVDLNAAYPNMPLEPVNVFAGSAASFTICNVPRAVGDRAITSVAIEFKTRGGVSETLQAVRVGSAWEVTIPASRFPLPYSAALGVRIVGIGKDENKCGATWVIGVADLIVLNNQGQVTPGADAGDVKHSEFADLDPDTASLADVITRLKGSAMTFAIVLTSLLVSFSAIAALPVTPVYTNHNRVAGNVQTMTNIQEWASAVETAIGQGGGSSMDTNGVQSIIQRNIDTNLLCTVEAAQAMTNSISVIRDLDNSIHANRDYECESISPFHYTEGSEFVVKHGANPILPEWNDEEGKWEIQIYEPFHITREVSGVRELNALKVKVEIESETLGYSGYVTAERAFVQIKTKLAVTNEVAEIVCESFPVVTNAYTKTQVYSKSDIDGTSVTNGGAKAYADATFAKIGDIPSAPDYSTNNVELVTTITNLAPSKAMGIVLHDPTLNCNWYLSADNGSFTWYVEE